MVLPALVPQASRPHPPGAASTGRGGDIADVLAALGDGGGRQGFHAPLRDVTWRYARQCSRTGNRDDEALKAKLRAAIRAAPCRPDRDIETSYCQDYYLDRLITGAFSFWPGAETPVTAPHHTAPTQSVEAARLALARHMGEFIATVAKWHASPQETSPPHSAIMATVGTGKSSAARSVLPDFIATAKTAHLPHRVLWLLPTHKLGNETLAAMEALGLTVAVMRGREAEEPGTADPEYEHPGAEDVPQPTRRPRRAGGMPRCGTSRVWIRQSRRTGLSLSRRVCLPAAKASRCPGRRGYRLASGAASPSTQKVSALILAWSSSINPGGR